MNNDRWRRIEELFEGAVELDPGQRAEYLDKECAGDTALLKQVQSLIRSEQEAGSFIDQAIRDAADQFDQYQAPSAEGQRIGNYQVVKEIGRGGMGAVYLAHRADDEYQKQVAIKLVRAALPNSEVLRRFRSERQILANLDHPNIATLLDGGTTNSNTPYVVMEYVEGIPIDEYCDRNSLSIDDRLRLFRRVCAAVQYAHQNLVVHRDIKPSNILVTTDGEPKLLDFGIAKLMKPDASFQTVAETRTDVRLMTPEYASPEQVRGEPISTATDVYSLGVVLYELLTGHRPYALKNYTAKEVEEAICGREPEKPSTAVSRDQETVATDNGPSVVTGEISERRSTTTDKLKRQLRGDLDNIVLMAIRKEPVRRYVSVEQLSEDIRRHLEGLPVAARPSTFGYLAQKFVQRHRAMLATTAAVITLIAFLVGFYTVRLASERDRAQLEAAKAKQVSDFLAGVFAVSDPGQSKGDTVTAKELLDRGATRIETELASQPQVQATMMNTMGRVYRSLGLYSQAERLLDESVRISRQVLEVDDPQLAQSLFDHAELFHYQHKYDEAEPRYHEALAIRRKRFGENHLDVANTLDLLGRLMRDKTNYDEAERLHREALEIRRKVAGENSADFAESLHSLGMVAEEKGDSKASETYFRQELAILQKLGKEYPALLFNLGTVLSRTGQYEEAISIHRDAVTLARKIYGEEHPFVANSLEGFGLALNTSGDQAAAEPLLRQALEMRRKLHGDKSPDFALSMNNLARVLNAKGDYTEAENLFRRALDLFTRQFGDEHPRVGDTKNNLSQLLYTKGDYAEAEKICRETLALDLKQLGADHPYIATDKYNLARIVRARGDSQTAESLFKEALDLQKKKLRGGHPSAIATMIGLGGVLVDRGDSHQAEAVLREALALRKQALPEGSWEIAEAESELGYCLAKFRRFDEAEPLLLQSYQILKTKRGAESKQTRLALDHIIDLYQAWRRPIDAAPYIALKPKPGR
jgi:serine/threonine-protein kinase